MKNKTFNSDSLNETWRRSCNDLYNNILSAPVEWLIVDKFWAGRGDEQMINSLIRFYESEEDYEKCRVLKVFLECFLICSKIEND